MKFLRRFRIIVIFEDSFRENTHQVFENGLKSISLPIFWFNRMIRSKVTTDFMEATLTIFCTFDIREKWNFRTGAPRSVRFLQKLMP